MVDYSFVLLRLQVGVSYMYLEGRIGFREPGSVEPDRTASVCQYYCSYVWSVSNEKKMLNFDESKTRMKYRTDLTWDKS